MDRARDMKEWMDSVHEAISDLQTWRVNTDDSIKALTERVKELENRFNEHVGYWPENHTKSIKS